MSNQNYDTDEIEFVGVITVDSDAIVIADPTKKVSDGVIVRNFGGSGVYPVFIIKDEFCFFLILALTNVVSLLLVLANSEIFNSWRSL